MNGPPPRAGIAAARGGGDPGAPNGARSIEMAARAGGESDAAAPRRSRRGGLGAGAAVGFVGGGEGTEGEGEGVD